MACRLNSRQLRFQLHVIPLIGLVLPPRVMQWLLSNGANGVSLICGASIYMQLLQNALIPTIDRYL